jgi:hypothetical protein
VTKGERQLTDMNEGLLRRVHKRPPRKYGPILDQITGRLRAPAAAFEPRFPDPAKPEKIVDEALSINVQSSLHAASLPLTWGADLERQYVARVTVADCSVQTLEAWHKPILSPKHENPHHGLIWGLVEMHRLDQPRYERALDALARASTIVSDEVANSARGAAHQTGQQGL